MLKVSQVVAAALLVAACGLTDQERDQVSDIASTEAHDAISEHEKISSLESSVEDLETRLAALEERLGE